MNIFDPVQFSRAENEFFLSELGKPPVVAMAAVRDPVNPRAVKPVLDRIYELQELEKHQGEKWVGVEAVREAIQTYLEQSASWASDRRRGRPRFPSLYSFDQRGRGHLYGPGSDSGWVKTYFDKAGNRIPFAIRLVDDGVTDWTPEWEAQETPKDSLLVDADKRRVECSVCNHTESFNPESRASFNAARARMSKHLRSATQDVDRHRELHTNEFH